jgi:MFS transporter, ACS family, hexuronate transporter
MKQWKRSLDPDILCWEHGSSSKTRTMLSHNRWVPISFLFAGGLINYMDRSALSVAAPLVMRDLRLDAAQLGIIFSSFFAGYALFNFIGGSAADLFGPKRVFAFSMTAWSVFCGLTAAATGFSSLLVIRVLFGCGEGPFAAAANKMVNNWFSPRRIATAIGLANAGTPIGGALSGTVVGWVAAHYGWRASFIVLAALGLLWTLCWALTVNDRPALQEQGDMEGLKGGCGGLASPRKSQASLSFYLRQPTVIATGAAFFSYSYVLYFFLSWFPSYLMMSRHLDIGRMSLLNTIPWILGTFGLLLSGLVCDFLTLICPDLLTARKLVLVVCLVLTAICVSLTGLVSNLSWSVALMAVTIFCVYLTGATYWAIIQDVVSAEHVGAAGGFVHLIANCAGIVGPAITGFIVQATGTFTSVFLLAGGVALLGALAVAVFVRRS